MKDILKQRLELLDKTNKNKQLQQVEMEYCRRNILYWFKTYLYTDRNVNLFTGDELNVLPFIPFPFQEEAITEIWSSIITWTKPINKRDDFCNVFIEKSRQMGMSWIVMWIFVYWYIFHNHKYLVLSQKEKDVDEQGNMKSLFEKIRFMLRNLPSRMLPKWYDKKPWTDHNKKMSISRSDWTWSITGESWNANAWRWGTYTAVFMDEMAHMQYASSINTAVASATPCRIFNSTPNGEWNEFYRMRLLTTDRKDSLWNIQKAEIKWLRYHWTDHPLYDTEWYEKRIKGMSKEKIAQELEIDYNTALEWRVYPEYRWQERQLEYNPLKPLYIWIDNSHWGTDPHAIVVAQTDPNTHFIDIIDCMQINCSIPDMANIMAGTPKVALNDYENAFLQRYLTYNWKRATFVSDPYDTNSTIKNLHSPQWIVIADEYRKVWINLNVPKRSDIKTRIMNTRANLYRVRVSERCKELTSSLMNARYPTPSENSSRTTVIDKPIHDWTSHFRTAVEYWVAFILENDYVAKKRIIEDTRPKRDMITWKLIYN